MIGKYIHAQLKFSHRAAAIIISLALLSGCQTIEKTLTITQAEDSYRQGNHERAFKLSEVLAYEGDVMAQYALGYMYFHGIGAPRDQALGLYWIRMSASHGYKPAIEAMEMVESYQTIRQEPLMDGKG